MGNHRVRLLITSGRKSAEQLAAVARGFNEKHDASALSARTQSQLPKGHKFPDNVVAYSVAAEALKGVDCEFT